MSKKDSGTFALASLLDRNSAGELISQIVRGRLQELIELEVSAVLSTGRHERCEERSCYRNGHLFADNEDIRRLASIKSISIFT